MDLYDEVTVVSNVARSFRHISNRKNANWKHHKPAELRCNDEFGASSYLTEVKSTALTWV